MLVTPVEHTGRYNTTCDESITCSVLGPWMPQPIVPFRFGVETELSMCLPVQSHYPDIEYRWSGKRNSSWAPEFMGPWTPVPMIPFRFGCICLPVRSHCTPPDIEDRRSGKRNSSGNPYDILPEDLDWPAGREKGHCCVGLERYGNPDNLLDWRKHQGFTVDGRIELLRLIMDQYLSGRQDKMKTHTVVVLTDEMWKTDQVAAVSKLLTEFENSPRRHGSPNNFRINFHRIGDNERGCSRITRLQERFS
jgi:hypothetical protein